MKTRNEDWGERKRSNCLSGHTLPTLDLLGEDISIGERGKGDCSSWTQSTGLALWGTSLTTLWPLRQKGADWAEKGGGNGAVVISWPAASPEGRDTAPVSALSIPLPIPGPCAETSPGLKGHDCSFLLKAVFPNHERQFHQAGLVRGIHVPVSRVCCGCTGPLSSLTSVHTVLMPVGLRGLCRAPERSI